MSDQPAPKTLSPRTRLLLAIAVIALGLAIAAFFGIRTVRSARQLQYIHQQGLDRGTASIDAIRPWMTIRFIAVAYAVPEEYIYSTLEIPFDRRNADQSLGELNKQYQLGNEYKPLDLLSKEQHYPGGPRALVDAVRGALEQRKDTP